MKTARGAKPYEAIVILCAIALTFVVGCNTWDIISDQMSICSIVNCDQLGLTDIAGPKNLLVPDWPDYDSDPLCVIPGFCGGSIWYPYSWGTTQE